MADLSNMAFIPSVDSAHQAQPKSIRQQLLSLDGMLFRDEMALGFYTDVKFMALETLRACLAQGEKTIAALDTLARWSSRVAEAEVQRLVEVFPDAADRLTNVCALHASMLHPSSVGKVRIHKPKLDHLLKGLLGRLARHATVRGGTFEALGPVEQDFVVREAFRSTLSNDCIRIHSTIPRAPASNSVRRVVIPSQAQASAPSAPPPPASVPQTGSTPKWYPEPQRRPSTASAVSAPVVSTSASVKVAEAFKAAEVHAPLPPGIFLGECAPTEGGPYTLRGPLTCPSAPEMVTEPVTETVTTADAVEAPSETTSAAPEETETAETATVESALQPEQPLEPESIQMAVEEHEQEQTAQEQEQAPHEHEQETDAAEEQAPEPSHVSRRPSVASAAGSDVRRVVVRLTDEHGNDSS